MTTRFLIELSSKPGTDLIRALRRGLKYWVGPAACAQSG